MEIPKYLKNKLLTFNITTLDDILKYNPIQLYALLKEKNPGLNFNVLFHLYSIYKKINFSAIDSNLKIILINEYKQLLPKLQNPTIDEINYYLNKALNLANKSYIINEVPIGAIIVKNNTIIGKGYNKTIKNNSILGHAEILAIQSAQKKLNNYRLIDCDLYVTIEPCVMCIGAIMNARIKRVIFGALEPKTGAIKSQYNILNNNLLNHHTQSIGPINNIYYSQILKDFFKKKRGNHGY
jgi:tRNA(Arg) A34 adenosine deaminase TadA